MGDRNEVVSVGFVTVWKVKKDGGGGTLEKGLLRTVERRRNERAREGEPDVTESGGGRERQGT